MRSDKRISKVFSSEEEIAAGEKELFLRRALAFFRFFPLTPSLSSLLSSLSLSLHFTQQVQSLLSVLCEETQLAELEVRLGSFELHVVRSRDNLSSTPSSSSSSGAAVQVAPGAPTFPTPAPGTAFASTASMDGAALGSAASSATASFDATMSLDDDDAGVSTLLLGSPKVGLLRRGRYVKGKRVGKGNAVEEGAEVKKGQVLG